MVVCIQCSFMVQVFPNVKGGWSPIPRCDPAWYSAVGSRQRYARFTTIAIAVHCRPRVPTAPLHPTRGAVPKERSAEG